MSSQHKYWQFRSSQTKFSTVCVLNWMYEKWMGLTIISWQSWHDMECSFCRSMDEWSSRRYHVRFLYSSCKLLDVMGIGDDNWRGCNFQNHQIMPQSRHTPGSHTAVLNINRLSSHGSRIPYGRRTNLCGVSRFVRPTISVQPCQAVTTRTASV